MTELQWTPGQIGGLTPLQLICLAHRKPPPLGATAALAAAGE